jgi:hypothetical protein
LSIGWEPRKWEYVTEKDETLRVIREAQLFEVSLCEWGRDPAALVEEVYRRLPMSATQQHALAAVLHMEALTRQYGVHRSPVITPEPPRPLVPSYDEWPPALRPQLIERRMQAVITMEKAEREYQQARHKHRMTWAGILQAKAQRGF